MNYKLKNNKRNHSFEYIFFLKKTSETSWNQDPESDPDPLFMIRNDTNPQH